MTKLYEQKANSIGTVQNTAEGRLSQPKLLLGLRLALIGYKNRYITLGRCFFSLVHTTPYGAQALTDFLPVNLRALCLGPF